MKKTITVAVLGSTGYVGLELIYILSRHPGIKIIFLGSENFPNKDIRGFDKRITNDTLPKLWCQKWGAIRGNTAIESSIPTKGTTQNIAKFSPSK